MCISLCVIRISVSSSDVTSSRTLEERSARQNENERPWFFLCISETWHTAEIPIYRRWIEEDDDIVFFNIARCIAISSTLLHKGIKRSINHSNEHVRVVLFFFFFFNTRNFLSFLSFFSNRRWNYGNVLLTKENLISTDSPRIVQFITVKRICNINNY